VPSGTIALLFSDLEGSTELLRRLRSKYAGLLDEHQRLLRETLAAYGGRTVDSQGDSVFVVFPRVADAAAAAAEAQRAVTGHRWPEDVRVRVRMGLHAGEPLVAEDRYVGLGVHRAARICAAAHGGQVLLSQAAASLLADNEPPDVTLRDLGEHPLKDFERPERLFQLVIRGLPADFPPLRTAAPANAAQPEYDFRILGPLEVFDPDERSLPLGGQKQRAVLALLLLEQGRVSTDALIDRLWGEEPPRTATTSLQNVISRLRKLLGTDRVLTRPPGYAIRLEPDELDLTRFERLVVEARELKPEGRAHVLRQALELWRGAPLAEFAYESFAQNEIARMEELRSSVLEDRIDADLELGRHSELVGELEHLVKAHPLRERLRGQLMLALYRCGRQAEALQAFQEARRTLVEELGIDPSQGLQELERMILRQEGALETAAAATPLADHYGELLDALVAGRLVPVLGSEAGVARESQYVAVTRGSGPLYDELHSLFDIEIDPGAVHHVLARLPAFLRQRNARQPLLVTTNYDMALERALVDAGEEFDVVTYVAVGPSRGKFIHHAPDGRTTVIDVANSYADLSFDDRPVILKIHGQVDRRPDREWESFVVSEDDYIDYLTHTDIANLVPVTLAAKLRRSHFLFLGYSPQEWNFRVFLHRVWGGQKVHYRSWAVGPRPDAVAREFWRHIDVDLLDLPLEQYVGELDRRVAAAEAA
jgi:DNA-binding SARP family transcriptional activator/class 3 adenylate cyclase